MAKDRNYGIDFLRAVSMLMVLLLHLVNQGDVIGAADYMSGQYLVSWLITIACYCAVDCFAAISGYVGVEACFSWKRLFLLWFTVAFYSLGITVVFSIMSPGSISLRQWASAAAPIVTNQYWYMTAYFGMFLFIPIMNCALNSLSKEALLYFLITIVVILCLIPNVAHCMNTSLGLKNGYSAIWLIIMYLVGGIVKKLDVAYKLNKTYLLLLFSISTVFVFLSKLLIDGVSLRICGVVKGGSTFVDYTSPFILLNAILLLLIFSRIEINSGMLRKFVGLISSTSLGVYLIHTHPIIWDNLLYKSTVHMADLSTITMTLVLLTSAVLIYFVCHALDQIRQLLFKFLSVPVLCGILEQKWLCLLSKCHTLIQISDCE